MIGDVLKIPTINILTGTISKVLREQKLMFYSININEPFVNLEQTVCFRMLIHSILTFIL